MREIHTVAVTGPAVISRSKTAFRARTTRNEVTPGWENPLPSHAVVALMRASSIWVTARALLTCPLMSWSDHRNSRSTAKRVPADVASVPILAAPSREGQRVF